jgi:hypothetical protein
MRMR